MYEEALRKAGLTGNEAKVYQELIRRGTLGAYDLSRKIGMDRTLAYTVLNHLIEKGMVNYITRSGKRFFAAASPENLLNPLKEKEAFVSDLIAKLKKVERLTDLSQEVNVYEGKEGLRAFMNDLLRHKTFCSFGATGRAYDALYEFPRLAKKLTGKEYSARIITSAKYRRHAMTKLPQIKIKYLDVHSDATTTIFGENVAIHVVAEKPIVIVMKNPVIARSYQAHFEILWSAAKEETSLDGEEARKR